MTSSRFSFVVYGEAVESGEIDVNELAPALLSIGNLIQSANNALNGERATASVKVRATNVGSFEVDLNIVQTIAENAEPLLVYAKHHAAEITAANELADLVLKAGAIASVPAGGLIWLLRWLKGRKPDRVEDQSDGEVHVHLGDTYFITNEKTIRLAKELAVREHARKLVSLLERPGIESIAARREGEEELRLERSDIHSFDVPDVGEEQLTDETREMALQIISLSFKEDNKWRLTDGAEPFSATIDDIDFLNKIANNQISFAKNDYLRCKVRERQSRTSHGLKKERTIIEVLEHIPAPRQLRFI